MRNMREHSEELDWAGAWFRWLSRAAIVLTILGAIGQIVSIARPTALNAAFNAPTMQFISAINLVTIIIGGLISAFLLRVGSIVCSFLADFARGMLAQQIRREHQNQQPS